MLSVAVNAEQSEDWNGASGREFIEQRERHERMLGQLAARLLAVAGIQDGEQVLDAGCGETTILAARAPAAVMLSAPTFPGSRWPKRAGSPLPRASLTPALR